MNKMEKNPKLYFEIRKNKPAKRLKDGNQGNSGSELISFALFLIAVFLACYLIGGKIASMQFDSREIKATKFSDLEFSIHEDNYYETYLEAQGLNASLEGKKLKEMTEEEKQKYLNPEDLEKVKPQRMAVYEAISKDCKSKCASKMECSFHPGKSDCETFCDRSCDYYKKSGVLDGGLIYTPTDCVKSCLFTGFAAQELSFIYQRTNKLELIKRFKNLDDKACLGFCSRDKNKVEAASARLNDAMKKN